MTVTIVGTLEMIYSSGGETVSEAVHVDFVSPTDVPLPLHEVIVFTERNPPVDIRIPLEAHLEEDHGFTSVTRVPVSREGAMAEWTVVRSDSIPANIVLWFLVPLQQEGVEWGVTAVGDEGLLWGYQSIPIGDGAEATGEASIAIGYNAKSTDESSTAMGHESSATGKQSLAVGRDSNASSDLSTAIGVDAQATGNSSFAAGHGAEATGANSVAVGKSSSSGATDALAVGTDATATNANSVAMGTRAAAAGIDAVAVGGDANAAGNYSVAGGRAAKAIGGSSIAIGQTSGVRAASSFSIAIGTAAVVDDSSPYSWVIGPYGYVPASTPNRGTLRANQVNIDRAAFSGTGSTTLGLLSPDGSRAIIQAENDDTLSVNGTVFGKTHFGRASGSPLTENTTLVVSTFSQAKSLWLTTLADLIPATATGTWTVKMTASAVVSRSVTTGGMYLFPSINGDSRPALPRGLPQANAYTVTRTHVIEGCTGTSALEVRYGGQGTAGQTNVWDWNVDITAVRTG